MEKFRVNVRDREYQFWQYRPLSVELWSQDVFEQKLDYIHNNPVQEKWKLAELPEEYYYSSAAFYFLNKSDWDFITHYAG